jgi:anti-sigma B factor antagonist
MNRALRGHLEVMHIDERRLGGANVLELHGDLDLRSAPQLRGRLAHALQREVDVIVDLSDVDFIDSTGLAALLNALRRMTRAGRSLTLIAPPGSAAQRLLQLTRLDSTFRVQAVALAA